MDCLEENANMFTPICHIADGEGSQHNEGMIFCVKIILTAKIQKEGLRTDEKKIEVKISSSHM